MGQSLTFTGWEALASIHFWFGTPTVVIVLECRLCWCHSIEFDHWFGYGITRFAGMAVPHESVRTLAMKARLGSRRVGTLTQCIRRTVVVFVTPARVDGTPKGTSTDLAFLRMSETSTATLCCWQRWTRRFGSDIERYLPLAPAGQDLMPVRIIRCSRELFVLSKTRTDAFVSTNSVDTHGGRLALVSHKVPLRQKTFV